MARPLKIEYPGAFYHIASRGNECKKIFKSLRDRERFLSYGKGDVPLAFYSKIGTWSMEDEPQAGFGFCTTGKVFCQV